MGFFSEDMAPMLGVYEAETSELMATLDEIVSRVEQNGEFASDDIAGLFRCAHTVKGSSGMMGLDALSNLTHKVEDLFDLLRGDPTLADGRVPDILDCLYSFSDFVKDEIGRMDADDFTPASTDALVAEIASFTAALAGGDADGYAAGAGGPQASDEWSDDASDGQAEGGESTHADEPEADEAGRSHLNGTTLRVGFKPDVPMVNARALVIVKQLGNQVRVLSHVPENLMNADAAQIIAEEGLLIVVDTADAEKARQTLAKNSFIRRITVLDEVESASAAPSAEQGGAAAESQAPSDKFIKLRWDNVRDLQDMAGEFFLRASHLKALCAGKPDERTLRNSVSHITRLAEDLVFHVNKMAMVSMSAMVPQLSRMVRDMCRSTGKQVSFQVHGGNIEIDRNLYNSIADPLLHIVRNAVDHGIEPPEARLAAGKEARGKVTLSIQNLGARVMFRVSDDGRGIDTDKVIAEADAKGMLERPASSYSHSEILHMVMLAGLSTSGEVTQYSGRGVGMDVVNAVVRDFHGRVEIESEPGRGTTMSLFMPVSVTSVECLCFRIGRSVYPMPLLNLNKVFTADEAASRLSDFEGSILFDYEKRQIPVLDMHRLLDCEGESSFYIVCHSMEDEFVICVDDVLGDFSCANKPLPPCLGPKWQATCPIRNVAIMDDGTVGYVLNAPLLADLAQGRTQVPDSADEPDDAGQSLALETPLAADIPTWAFVFALGDDWYALPVDCVERLNPLSHCAETPRGLPFLKGLVNYRTQVIPVFDLAESAGVHGECPYELIIEDKQGDFTGLAITSAIGVRDLSNAAMAEEQPAPRMLACGLRTVATLVTQPKTPPITLLARG